MSKDFEEKASYNILDLIESDNPDTDNYWFEMVEQLLGENIENLEELKKEVDIISFEEQFPSLVKSGILTVDGIPEIEIIPIRVVEIYCLDKQIVKDAVKKLRESLVNAKDGVESSKAFDEFEKEVGI